MKKILLLLLIPIICFSQKKETVFIQYFVPISIDVKKKYHVHINNINSKYCSRIVSNYSSSLNNISSLSNNTKEILYNNIFNQAKSGELIVYQYNNGVDIYGPAPNGTWIGEKNIMNKNQIKNAISYYKVRDSTEIVNGNEGPVIDNYGEIIKIDYLEECKINDFIGISFYEEWTIDYKNLVIDKKILYYAPGINHYNPETLELIGYRNPFIVENINVKSKQKIVEDFYSNTEIFCDYSTSESWFKNNLEPSVKFKFIDNLYNDENLLFYEFSPPYNKQISKIDAFSYEYYRDSIGIDEEGYEYLAIDEYGNPIKIKINLLIMPNDINSFGFLEDWYFDSNNSSFKKEIKGLTFEIINYDSYKTDLKSEPFFLKK